MEIGKPTPYRLLIFSASMYNNGRVPSLSLAPSFFLCWCLLKRIHFKRTGSICPVYIVHPHGSSCLFRCSNASSSFSVLLFCVCCSPSPFSVWAGLDWTMSSKGGRRHVLMLPVNALVKCLNQVSMNDPLLEGWMGVGPAELAR